MTSLFKVLARTYFIETAMNTLFDKLWINFVLLPIVKEEVLRNQEGFPETQARYGFNVPVLVGSPERLARFKANWQNIRFEE